MDWDYISQWLILGLCLHLPLIVYFLVRLFLPAYPGEQEVMRMAKRAAYLQRVRAENLAKERANG